MATITPLDRLFVTVSQNGTTKMLAELTGVSSFADIVRYTRNHIAGLSGMTTFIIRNTTCGWSSRQSVLVRG